LASWREPAAGRGFPPAPRRRGSQRYVREDVRRFLSNALGNKLAGWTTGFSSSMPRSQLFGTIAGVSLVAALIMFVLIRPVKQLMGGVS
jgi:hypothetical protein